MEGLAERDAFLLIMLLHTTDQSTYLLATQDSNQVARELFVGVVKHLGIKSTLSLFKSIFKILIAGLVVVRLTACSLC